jgi:hypothetical protein
MSRATDTYQADVPFPKRVDEMAPYPIPRAEYRIIITVDLSTGDRIHRQIFLRNTDLKLKGCNTRTAIQLRLGKSIEELMNVICERLGDDYDRKSIS